MFSDMSSNWMENEALIDPEQVDGLQTRILKELQQKQS